MPIAGRDCGGLRDTDRIGPLHDNVLNLHGRSPFNRSEVSLDTAKAALLFEQVVLDLDPAHPEHSA